MECIVNILALNMVLLLQRMICYPTRASFTPWDRAQLIASVLGQKPVPMLHSREAAHSFCLAVHALVAWSCVCD